MNRVEKMYSTEHRAIIEQLKNEPLIFRRTAHQALDAFSKNERRFVNKLRTTLVDPLDFYVAWDEALDNLHKVDGARNSKPLANALGRHLLLKDKQSSSLAARLVEERTESLHRELLDTVYRPEDTKARTAVRVLLAEDEATVKRQWATYVTYTLYERTARDNSIALADKSAPLIARPIRALREKTQVRRFTRKTQRILKDIQVKIAGLEAQDGGILASIFALNVSLVAMHDTHRRYEKEIATLSKADQQSAAKRLSIYEKHIAKVRKQHIESLPASDSLREIRSASQELDTVLMRVFDMGDRSYNELMRRMKHYRELTREQERLNRLLDTSA